MNPPPNKPQEWMRSGEDEEPLRRYLQAIRERVWFLVLALIVTTAAAAAYVATAEKVYEAQVDVVVSPIQDPEGSLSSLPVITGSNDPLRAVETAATLLLNNVAAERTAAELGLDRSSQSILRDITAEPVAESDIVTITARANSAQGAADRAGKRRRGRPCHIRGLGHCAVLSASGQAEAQGPPYRAYDDIATREQQGRIAAAHGRFHCR